MGLFGMVFTEALVLVAVSTVIYLIFHAVYNMFDTAKGVAVIALILDAIMLIVLFASNTSNIVDEKKFTADLVGMIAVTGIVCAISAASLFVASNHGDYLGDGIGYTITASVLLMTIATVLQRFAGSLWPLIVVIIMSILGSLLAWKIGDDDSF